MFIHTIFNIGIDVLSILTVSLYIRFLYVQAKTILLSANKDSLTPGFTITLIFIGRIKLGTKNYILGTYNIIYTMIDLLFVELPQWGASKELNAWYLEDAEIKGKFVSVAKMMSSPINMMVTLILAANRFMAVQYPVQYKKVD